MIFSGVPQDMFSLESICLVLLFLCCVYQLYFHFFYFIRVARRVKVQAKMIVSEKSYPGVSVILCARNEDFNLENYLQVLLSQDYPLFEVIVIDDGSSDYTNQVLKNYQSQYDNLYLSSVPRDSKILSTKKLGITLGVRKSRYDYVLLTEADSCPQSNLWIKSMMNAFLQSNNQTDIVLGFSPYFKDNTYINSLIAYDTLVEGIHYLGASLNSLPYMGIGRNIGYRKSFFCDCGGFKTLMKYKYGDNHLFVNHFGKSENTTIVICPNSLVWSIPKLNFCEWFRQKRHHLSVVLHYKKKSMMHILCEPITRCGIYLFSLFLLFSAPYDIKFIASAVLILYWLIHLIAMNGMAAKISYSRWGFSIIIWNILMPILDLILLITNRKIKKLNEL